VLLAVIGPHWLSATDSEGRRRVDDVNDFIRLEKLARLSGETFEWFPSLSAAQ
jgi:hypothetical protein